MRTTIDLDPDVLAAVDQLRQAERLGLSEAVNELARRGMAQRPTRKRFRQRAVPLGLRIDVANVAEALETLEGPDNR